MAPTSSLNWLCCRYPYQTPHSLNPSPFSLKTPSFLTEKCFCQIPFNQNRLLCIGFVTGGIVSCCLLGRDMGGGAKRMGGGKRTRERALPKIFGPLQKSLLLLVCSVVDFCTEKRRPLTPERRGKRTVRGKVQDPFLGGVLFVRFSTPRFFHPPPPLRPLITRPDLLQRCRTPKPRKVLPGVLGHICAFFSYSWGARGGAREGARPPFLSTRNRSWAPSQAPSQHPPPWRPLSLGILPHSWALLQVYLVPSWPKLLQNNFLGAFSFGVVIVTKISTKGIISKKLLIVIIPWNFFFVIFVCTSYKN